MLKEGDFAGGREKRQGRWEMQCKIRSHIFFLKFAVELFFFSFFVIIFLGRVQKSTSMFKEKTFDSSFPVIFILRSVR